MLCYGSSLGDWPEALIEHGVEKETSTRPPTKQNQNNDNTESDSIRVRCQRLLGGKKQSSFLLGSAALEPGSAYLRVTFHLSTWVVMAITTPAGGEGNAAPSFTGIPAE